jgi:hypothetical protein
MRFTELADRKKNIYDQDLISLVTENRRRAPQPTRAAAMQAGAQ